jgi:hypothetical protein
MKTVNYTRVEKPGSTTLCSMEFERNAVILDFGKKQGGKLKLGRDFLADAVEYYLLYAINIGLEKRCPSKKVRRKKR